MADITFLERRQLEQLLGMSSGYVLDFSNRAFQEFVIDAARRDILDTKYDFASCSKANRLRQFLKVESDHVVGVLVKALVDYAETLDGVDTELVAACRKIAERLQHSQPVSELDAIQPLDDDQTFEALARLVRDAIENNEPEGSLDRLHTYVVKYVRAVCEKHGLDAGRKKPLHSIFGGYVKYLRSKGLLESDMTERILKSSVSVLESFNHVRNNHSLAHDNVLLGYEESLLVFNHVCASMRFLQSLEAHLEQLSG